MKKEILQLIKDIKNYKSDLWDMNYGCDGMSDECCGNCGGNELSEYSVIERLEKIIKSKRK